MDKKVKQKFNRLKKKFDAHQTKFDMWHAYAEAAQNEAKKVLKEIDAITVELKTINM